MEQVSGEQSFQDKLAHVYVAHWPNGAQRRGAL